MNEKSAMEQAAIQDYEIDRRLKPGKDYPEGFAFLIEYFRQKHVPGIPVKELSESSKKDPKEIARRMWLASYFQKQCALAERTFKEYFLSLEINREKCIERINTKLRGMSPQLLFDAKGGHELVFKVTRETVLFGMMELWELLAKAIDSKGGLNPKLVHQCPYCKKIFFSRQRKKYHSECLRRFFSEKYKKEGLGKKWAKDYRERKAMMMK